MRRLLPVLLVLLAACGRGEALTSATPLHEAARPAHVLRIPDPSGVSLLDTDAGRVLTRVRDGVRSRNWVFQARLTPTGTLVHAVDGRGESVWQRDLDGDLAVRVASSDGTRVGLLPFEDARVDPYHPAGRLTTALTVLPTDGGEPRTYELDGNFEPEAFSTSGRSLFVVEYVPPEAPDRYRVRKLDLDTGEVGAVYSVDGHLQESMRGTARVQAMDADGSRLYTLYTTDDGTAFVHVLDLDEEWAHCVDLPAPIGASPEQLLAIAASPEDDRVVVVDALAGVAELDTASLTVDRTVELVVDPTQAGRVMALLGRDGRLLTGVGTTLAVLDRNLAFERMWSAPTTILGIHLDPGDERVWALGDEAIYALDPRTGDVLQAAALPDGMPRIDVPDPWAPVMQCAC
ncbi:MAG TPA: hypothetical protein VFU93_02570 [Acidimicrobiales bacterium]|nr:hypothetical protein [Acidimicrobiales bacterium]